MCHYLSSTEISEWYVIKVVPCLQSAVRRSAYDTKTRPPPCWMRHYCHYVLHIYEIIRCVLLLLSFSCMYTFDFTIKAHQYTLFSGVQRWPNVAGGSTVAEGRLARCTRTLRQSAVHTQRSRSQSASTSPYGVFHTVTFVLVFSNLDIGYFLVQTRSLLK